MRPAFLLVGCPVGRPEDTSNFLSHPATTLSLSQGRNLPPQQLCAISGGTALTIVLRAALSLPHVRVRTRNMTALSMHLDLHAFACIAFASAIVSCGFTVSRAS